jgi:hypothetical protein
MALLYLQLKSLMRQQKRVLIFAHLGIRAISHCSQDLWDLPKELVASEYDEQFGAW